MRLFISGAAAIDPEIMEDFNSMGITMFQGYGMTENSPIIAVHRDQILRCRISRPGYAEYADPH